MALLKFKDWLESSAATRTRHDVALGLKPLAALSGSVHGHSTASPFETEQIKSKLKKKVKKRKKAAKKSVPKNNQVDSWLQKAEGLKVALDKLKQAFSKSKDAVKKPDVKFAVPKDDPNKKDQGETNDSGKEQSGVQGDKERDQGSEERQPDKRDSSGSKQKLSKK